MSTVIAVGQQSLLPQLRNIKILVCGPSPWIFCAVRKHNICAMDSVPGEFNDASVNSQRSLEQILAEVVPVGQVEDLGSHSSVFRRLVAELGRSLEPAELSAVLVGPGAS